ncbi:MAG: DUF177 domain-containing protein [Chloroflexi bacterium]|nr:MAG: DUF177 domain-containing protein [Chloroflexota bacterium]
MQINVATLLQEPVGSRRELTLENETISIPDMNYVAQVVGRVRLMRSPRGVLAHANLITRPHLTCSRCLEEFDQPLAISLDEEFVPQQDPASGHPVEAEIDDFRIDEHNELDLSEAVRQYETAALPLQPVCRDDCAGLCPECGQNLNERPHVHEEPNGDGAWAGLAGLSESLRAEDDRGGTEA